MKMFLQCLFVKLRDWGKIFDVSFYLNVLKYMKYICIILKSIKNFIFWM